MGGTKYERVSRRDQDFDSDGDEQEVDLAQRDYADVGSSSLTQSSPSPVPHNSPPHSGGLDYRIQNGPGKGTDKATMYKILTTALVILLYFTLSIGLTFYQSSLLEVSKVSISVDDLDIEPDCFIITDIPLSPTGRALPPRD